MKTLIIGLLLIALMATPVLATSINVHVVDAYTGQSVSNARVEVWQDGSMQDWGYTDFSGDYNCMVVQGDTYTIRASSYNEQGSRSITVDEFSSGLTVRIG